MANDLLDDDLRAWFAHEGLMRTALEGGEHGEIFELDCPPVVALGPGEDDHVVAPHPLWNAYPGKPLAEMSLDDYNAFMFHWFEAAVAAGELRCANCGKRILPGDDLPDPDTWDAIFVEKELVAWMVVHFDCKKWLAKKLKGRTPFDLHPSAPPVYDLSHAQGAPAQENAEERMSDAPEY